MFKNLIEVIILISAMPLKGQAVDISFSLVDSCINHVEQTVAIQITVQNGSNKDIRIDLESINFTIYQEGNMIAPTEDTRIGLFTPKEKISKDGFLLVRKMSSEKVVIHTSLFRNYAFDKGKTYCLKGNYKDVRNKKAVYDIETDIGKINFKICD